ncbi:MAG: hypothetical protein PHO31_03245 [Candidatus Pacebacteria bacterium]|nr:hypothetical protein [Candidatus Paceibacterota bacterium]
MVKTKIRGLPKIIDSKLKQNIRESGCCFRSCGGVPGIQQIHTKALRRSSITKSLLSKIK